MYVLEMTYITFESRHFYIPAFKLHVHQIKLLYELSVKNVITLRHTSIMFLARWKVFKFTSQIVKPRPNLILYIFCRQI